MIHGFWFIVTNQRMTALAAAFMVCICACTPESAHIEGSRTEGGERPYSSGASEERPSAASPAMTIAGRPTTSDDTSSRSPMPAAGEPIHVLTRDDGMTSGGAFVHGGSDETYSNSQGGRGSTTPDGGTAGQLLMMDGGPQVNVAGIMVPEPSGGGSRLTAGQINVGGGEVEPSNSGGIHHTIDGPLAGMLSAGSTWFGGGDGSGNAGGDPAGSSTQSDTRPVDQAGSGAGHSIDEIRPVGGQIVAGHPTLTGGQTSGTPAPGGQSTGGVGINTVGGVPVLAGKPEGEIIAGAPQGGEAAIIPVHPGRVPLPEPSLHDSWRYGGGTNYPDSVSADGPFTRLVNTRAGLMSALEIARAGEIVYVANDARIDLTGLQLCVTEGVWLASGRGTDGQGGGLLYTTEPVTRAILKACGDNVRFTGLRIFGNDFGQCPNAYPDNCPNEDRTGGRNCRDCTSPSRGIRVDGVDNVEIDNCEMAGFSHAAIYVTDTLNLSIHHNHLHHTQREGLGYGIVLMRGGRGLVQLTAEWNRFDYFRHAIAGSGEPGQDYVARHNLVESHAIGHVFDMHGENENRNNGSEIAGGDIRIYDNIVLVDDYSTLVVRGRPDHGSFLYNNCLARRNAAQAALQRFFFGRFFIDIDPDGRPAANRYDQSPHECTQRFWCYARFGDGPWTFTLNSEVDLRNILLGDFDGDGRGDALRTHGGQWQWSSGINRSWARLNTSNVELNDLRSGDFDGDGRTDLFQATGQVWRVSDGGSSRWRQLRESTDSLDALLFGDFDGDGRTDVMKNGQGEWLWSRSGRGPWVRRNQSNVSLSQLVVGDFDGDGRDDLIRTRAGRWHISYGAAGAWTPAGFSNIDVRTLQTSDIDADGRTDLVYASGSEWLYSSGAQSRWMRFRIADGDVHDVRFVDIDGDGQSDMLRSNCY